MDRTTARGDQDFRHRAMFAGDASGQAAVLSGAGRHGSGHLSRDSGAFELRMRLETAKITKQHRKINNLRGLHIEL